MNENAHRTDAHCEIEEKKQILGMADDVENVVETDQVSDCGAKRACHDHFVQDVGNHLRLLFEEVGKRPPSQVAMNGTADVKAEVKEVSEEGRKFGES